VSDKRGLNQVILVTSAYIAAQMLADVTSLKIAKVGGFSIDAGTFVYPLTFTLRDLVHKTVGAAGARLLIFTAAAINLIMALLFAFTAALPPDPSWPLQDAYAAVLAPVWRVVIASIVAEVVAELVDTEVYRLWVERVTAATNGRGCSPATQSVCHWTALSSAGWPLAVCFPTLWSGASSSPTFW